MAEEDTETPDQGKTSILKGWAAIIASLAALVTAIGALLKPPQEPAAKAAYETLSTVVKETSEQTAKNHDDIVGLRNYLEGYTKGAGTVPAPSADAGTSVPIATTAAASTPTTSSSGRRLTARAGSSSGGDPLSGLGGGADRPPHPPAPPDVGPRPPVWEPPDFSQVQKKSK